MRNERLSEEERRRQLLQAACELGLAGGLAAVTGRAVAARAGLSSGLVFFHFGDKEGLFAALVDYVIEDLLSDLQGPVTVVDLLAQRLRPDGPPRVMPLLVELWVAGRGSPALHVQLTTGLARYRAAIAGLVDGPAEHKDAIARVAVTLVLGVALQAHVVDSDDLAATITAIDRHERRERPTR